MTPTAIDEFTTLFRPPASVCSEFEVEKISIPSNVVSVDDFSYTIPSRAGASILLFLNGSCLLESDTSIQVTTGTVLYLSAGKTLKLTSSDKQNVLLYRAHANLA